MGLDLKLLRTLLVAGVILILFHELVSHWGDVKAGFRDGYSDAARGTPAAGR